MIQSVEVKQAERKLSHCRPDAFLFMRHGETEYNQRRVRCGGDIDIPLTARGEAQARAAAESLQRHYPEIDAIIASPLQRTRRTAAIVQERFGAYRPLRLILSEGLVERRLGAWNGLDIAATQAALDAGACPPGGEAEQVFRARVHAALSEILSHGGYRLPLLVTSKGVGRVTALLLGGAGRPPVDNAEVLRFEIPATFWSKADQA